MSPVAGLWIHGAMPVQLLVVLAVAFLAVVTIQGLLKRIGAPITPFWQVISVWLLSYALFKWVIWPPFPSSLMVMYMVPITLILFVWISASEASWVAFKRYVLDTLTGASLQHRVLRAVVLVALPVIAATATYEYLLPPEITEPIEFRTYHPAPPQTITVQGQVIDLQTARNPFRVTK
jgi:hypothetical protein